MKKMFLLFCALCLLVFPSCSRGEKDLQGAVEAMSEATKKIAGSIFTTESAFGSPDYLSKELLQEMLGEFDFSGVRGTVYLSGSVSLFEVGVYECPSSDVAEAVGGLCAVRFEQALRTARNLGLPEADYTVRIYGNTVLAALCDESEEAVGAGMEKIKG